MHVCRPVNRADGRDAVDAADVFGKKTVANLPGEHGRILGLVANDGLHNKRRGHLRFRAPDDTRLNGPRFVPAGEDLRDAAVRHAQLTRYVARTHPSLRQVDDSRTDRLWQRTSVDVHTT